jgi:hypothetical protein
VSLNHDDDCKGNVDEDFDDDVENVKVGDCDDDFKVGDCDDDFEVNDDSEVDDVNDSSYVDIENCDSDDSSDMSLKGDDIIP